MQKLITALILICSLFSCVQSVTPGSESLQTDSGEYWQLIVKKDVIPESRTLVNPETLEVTWEDADRISALVQEGEKYTSHIFERNTAIPDAFYSKTFRPEEGHHYTLHFIYPAVENWTRIDEQGYSDAKLAAATPKDVPLVQYLANSTLHLHPAYTGSVQVNGTASPQVQLKHLNTLVRVRVKNTQDKPIYVRSIDLENSEAWIAGTAHFNPETAVLQMDESTSSKKLQLVMKGGSDLKPGKSQDYYLACPAFKTSSLVLKVHYGFVSGDKAGSKCAELQKSFEQGRSFGAGHLCTIEITTADAPVIPDPPVPERNYTSIKALNAMYPPMVSGRPVDTAVRIDDDLWLKGVVISNIVPEGVAPHNRFCEGWRFYLQDSKEPDSGIFIVVKKVGNHTSHGLPFGTEIEINLKGMFFSYDAFRTRMIKPTDQPMEKFNFSTLKKADPQRALDLLTVFPDPEAYLAVADHYGSMYVQVNKLHVPAEARGKKVADVVNFKNYSRFAFDFPNRPDKVYLNLLLYNTSPIWDQTFIPEQKDHQVCGISLRHHYPETPDQIHYAIFTQRMSDCNTLFK